jgi:hypothetical protein
MAEANRSIPQIPTTAQARITTAAHVLAQLRARQAVKRELQAYGHKSATTQPGKSHRGQWCT